MFGDKCLIVYLAYGFYFDVTYQVELGEKTVAVLNYLSS